MARLAKRKRKKASFGATLKYEIYGIILITLSVIALYGEAAGGRSLSKLFAYLLGQFYFLLALVGIWLGLHVMIKRKWPRGWTARRTGFVLLSLAFALWSAMGFADSRLGPVDAVSPSTIMSQSMSQLYEQIWQAPIEPEVRIWEKDVGGGLLGALQYSILYWLFGYYGSKFVLLVEFAISLMLITNRSFVEMAQAVRAFLQRFAPLFAARLSSGRKALRAKAVPVKEKKKTPAPLVDEPLQDEPPLESKPGKKPIFFQLFHGDEEREPFRYEEDDDEPIVYPAAGPKVNFQAKQPQDFGQQDEGIGRLFPDKGAASEGAFQPQAAYGRQEDGDGGEGYDSRDEDAASERLGSFSDLPEDERDEEWEPNVSDADAYDDPDEEEGSGAERADGESAGEAASSGAPKPLHKPKKPYRIPPLHLLNKPQGGGRGGSAADTRETARKLEATLESFGVRARVLDVARGPAVTRYELQPDVGVKVSRIVNLTDDIALALAAKDIRMEAPIPGKSAIGIEVPNSEVSIVTLREVLESQEFRDAQSKLSIALGRDISGTPIIGNLARMPHLLVAGATGSGKSVCINGIIASILYKAKPDEVKFLMIDPKMVELNVYNGIPHLLAPVVTDPRRAALALKKIVVEMEKRYEKFSKSGTRNIEGYNALMLNGDNPDAVLPYYVVIVDELADLMMVAAGDVEDSIMRLAQMARAAGIHLIIATQRPSVDVITGVIKANIPSRIAFGVSSQVDSRTILDMAGAEKLLGRGDMLFLPMGSSKPIRVQGAFLSDAEVEAVVSHVRSQAEAEYNEELVPEISEEQEGEETEIVDELFDQAVSIVLEAKQASVSLLQRRMRIGYTRAARLIDYMEAKGIVGPYEGSKPREVLTSLEQYQNNRASS
ncbi:MAG: cell division protein FtsK [Cohnella sp.]|uniref:DNA translocase FtsK n=1 Tax=Cohnella sp. TaxID=1883426 RepID=UPI000E387B51|nr:DNA translocase FtsK [Cohnella sp.]REK66283.1 MAG: cell division protein FtsK [Cohnella sp.]